jgi:polysaccharide deacetylase family protein (PEP-CTERM system associated)
MEEIEQGKVLNAFSCELEDWFHILASDKVPRFENWSKLTLFAERNIERLLQLFEDTGTRATFFCLGWMAERMPNLVRTCRRAGHEIGSHGYGHVLACEVGPKVFKEDVVRSKRVLEDITGEEVAGFRSAGFGVKNESRWVFDIVAAAGFKYDASVFPSHHGHGGLSGAEPRPHVVKTKCGPLIEVPVSTVKLLNYRLCLFGGGYLRLSPLWAIRWGAKQLRSEGQPLILYVHPREIDPDHPRLPLGSWRKFKCYVNLRGTMKKLKWLCENSKFTTMRAIAERTERMHRHRGLETRAGDKQKEFDIVEIGQRRKPVDEYVKVGIDQKRDF